MSYMNFNEKISRLIKSITDIDSKIELCRYYGFVNAYYHQGVYSDAELELELINEIYKREFFEFVEAVKPVNKRLHVISVAYDFGGHTRLCERLASMENCISDLIYTGFAKVTDSAELRISKFFNKVIRIESESNLNLIKKLVIELIKYKQIVLHIHPEDINAVVACAIAKKLANIRVFMVNHSDHTFIFGDTVIDYKLQLSGRGKSISDSQTSSEFKGIESFIGIPLHINNIRDVDNNFHHFIMAGSSWKMKPNKYHSAPKVVDSILSKNPSFKFTVIGVNIFLDYWWWFCKLKNFTRVFLYSKMSIEDYKQTIKSADACIDTVPISGGTAFVEMYLNGLHPLGIHSGVSGYTPLEAIKVNSIESILNTQFSDDISEDIKEKIKYIHDFSNVKDRYLRVLEGELTEFPKYLSDYPNDLEIFLTLNKFPLTMDFFRVLKKTSFINSLRFILVCFPHFYFYSFLTFVLKSISKVFMVISNKIMKS